MSSEEAGVFKALKSERVIRKRAQADNLRLADELAIVRLQMTKISAENRRFREDNYRLSAANEKLANEKRGHVEIVRRRDQTINALRAQLTERGITNE